MRGPGHSAIDHGKDALPESAERDPGRRYALPRRVGRVTTFARAHPIGSPIVALIVFTICVRLVWGWYLTARVTKEIDAIHSHGEPVTASEVVIEPVADEHNAWPLYVQAAGAMKPGIDSPRNSQLEYSSYPPFGAKWDTMARVSEGAHAKAFALARKARNRQRAQLRQTSPALAGVIAAGLMQSRTLANTLADGALYAQLKGDHAEAVERLLDGLHLGRSLRQDPLLVSQLIGIGIDAVALDAAMQIAPVLLVSADGGKPRGPASAAQVEKLIDVLLDESDAHQWFARSLVSERVVTFDYFAQQAAETWVIRPLAHQTLLRWSDGLATLIDAAKQPNYAAASKIMAPMKRTSTPVLFPPQIQSGRRQETPRYSRWFGDVEPGWRAVEQYYRLSAERRVAAVSFAARLFRIGNGRWPDSLAELAPRYLHAIPKDPFFDDARPLGYVIQRGVLPDGGDRPLVYFDPGGAIDALIDSEPMYGWQADPRPERRDSAPRQYRDLALWLPTTRRFDEVQRQEQLSAEAVDNDPEQSDAPGDNEDAGTDPDGPAEE
jgi:hypothetical protein